MIWDGWFTKLPFFSGQAASFSVDHDPAVARLRTPGSGEFNETDDDIIDSTGGEMDYEAFAALLPDLR